LEDRLAPVVRAVLLLDRQRGIAQEAAAVLVAGEGPGAERALVDGPLCPQAPVLGVGVVEEPRLEGVEEELLLDGLAHRGPGHRARGRSLAGSGHGSQCTDGACSRAVAYVTACLCPCGRTPSHGRSRGVPSISLS